MKVLHVATGFPVTFPGGVTNYVRSLARCQKRLGNQITVLCGALEPGADFTDFADRVVDYRGVAGVFSLSLDRDDVDKATFLHDLIATHDVVHFHMSYGFPKSFYAREIRTPYIVSLHDYGYICPRVFMVDKWEQTCDQRDLAKCMVCVGALEQVDVLRALANRARVTLPTIQSNASVLRSARMDRFLRTAGRCFATSTKVAKTFDAAVPGLAAEVVHIGNDSAGPIPKRSSWLGPSGSVRCCYLGTLNVSKGAEVFESLVRRLPRGRFEFSFWGRGDPRLIERLRALGVRIGGAYNPAALPTILADVDVGLVLPVWHDNGPQVLMEFLNNGIPVLGTRMGGIPDFLSGSTGHLFDPKDESGIADAANWLLGLTASSLAKMHAAMKPLKSPADHATEVCATYMQLVGT